MDTQDGGSGVRDRMLLLGASVAAMMLPLAGQAQDCGNLEMTQSISFEIVEGQSAACGYGGGPTTENSFARCYMPSDCAFTVRCVEIGVEENTGSALPAAVNIYIDSDGCPPTHPDIDLVLLASEPFIIPAGTFLELFEIELSEPVLINPGEMLVVELDYPAHTDGEVRPGGNDFGETACTYIRSEPCGIPNYICIPGLFPCCHWVQIVRGEGLAPSDLDGDGDVDAADLAQLLGAWGPCGKECPADLNGDGMVNAADLASLLGSWG